MQESLREADITGVNRAVAWDGSTMVSPVPFDCNHQRSFLYFHNTAFSVQRSLYLYSHHQPFSECDSARHNVTSASPLHTPTLIEPSLNPCAHPPQGGDQLRNQIQAINSQKLGAGQTASLPPPPAARPGPQAGPAGYGAPAALPPRPVTLAPPPRPSAPPPAVCTTSDCHSSRLLYISV